MSGITIELRPPPNIDFVNGFPGISPAGPERPQASVKGAIEVRVPATGIKAKWVKVELRKVEVLPPGGEANSFWDCVGPAPVNLWTSPDEYGVLRTQDFPFAIRIPESIPPSVELDNRASISYELVASVCTKGKRGFLRKAKSVVYTSKAPITIDKHELHSTWPIYNQPEIRHITQDGINLMVERNHTCFGPGDRIAVNVTVKSDSLHTVILRGFEIALKETTLLRSGPHGARGRAQPQSRTVTVAENKVMLNATMYGGQQKQAELSCTLNPKHTTPTLTAARHIDVTYTLLVKAAMGTGDNLFLELPVIISNWQRDVSAAAIQQIGPSPNLSNLPGTPIAPQQAHNQGFYGASHAGNTGSRAPAHASTLPAGRTSVDGYGSPQNQGRQNAGGMYGTGITAGGMSSAAPTDEFGFSSSNNNNNASSGAAGGSSSMGAGGRPVVAQINTGTATSKTGARPTSRGNPAKRLTVTNAHPSEFQDDVGGSSGSRQSQSAKQWPTAEEEKKLYEQARRRVENMQGPGAAPAPLDQRTSPPPTAMSSGSGSGAGGSSSSGMGSASQSRNPNQPPYMTAEEEKVMLFNKAQAAVLRNQGSVAGLASAASAGSSSGISNHSRSTSDAMGGGSSSSKPSGAQLYQQAMAARKVTQPAAVNAPTPVAFNPPSNVPVYRTAEQEKAALRRYEEARQAVDRTQGGGSPVGGGSSSGTGPAGRDSAPIAYDALFPGGNGGQSTPMQAPPPVQQQPPPFQTPPHTGPVAILSEKERLRREYEARDAAALAAQNAPPPQRSPPANTYEAPPPSFSAAPPPFTSAPAPAQYANAIAEKEALRRKFEAQDRAAAATAASLPPPAPLQTPSRGSSAAGFRPSNAGAPGTPIYSAPLSPGSRPTPPTPVQPQRILTAAEEKALLRAKYDAQDAAGAAPRPPQPLQPQRQYGGALPPPFSSNDTSANGAGNMAPPPLMPKPPVEYIQETREADAWVNGEVNGNGNGVLDVKPFTPFNAEFDRLRTPTPSMPPKPYGE